MADDFDPFGDITPQEQTAAQIAALRRQGSLGVLGQLTGDKVLAPLGQNLVSHAQHGQQMAQQAQDRSLLRAIQAQREQDNAQHYGNEDAIRAAAEARAKVFNARNGETIAFDPNTREATTLRAAPPPRPVLSRALAGKGATPQAQTADDATLNILADQFYATGKTSVSNRTPLFNAVVQRMAQRHPDADLASQGAAYHANSASYNEATKLRDAVDRNEAKAEADLGIAENAINKVGLTNNRALNRPILELKGNTSPEVAAFLTARQAAISQVSKVLSANPGAVTEGMRQEAEHLLREDLTPSQFQAALVVLRQDMARNKEAMHQSVKDIGGRISGKASAPPTTHTPDEIAAAKSWLADPKNGTPEQRAKVQAILGGQ